MIRRSEVTVADALGTPEPGVYITVKHSGGTLATLFHDDGSSLSNPFQSGTGGAFYYNIADSDEGDFIEEYRLSLSDAPRKIIAVSIDRSGLDGLFINASDHEVPVGTDVISTSGYSVLDKGGALYVYDAAVDAAYVVANPRSSFITANERGFRISLEQDITPYIFGALSDGTDSLAALNAAIAISTVIYLPEGDFVLSNTPTTVTGSFRMFGLGRLVINHSNSPALHIAPASVNNVVELDFEMVANSAAGPCPLGVEIAFPSTLSYPYSQANLNVRFRADLGSTGPTWAKTWGRAYKLSNIWYPEIAGYGSSAPIAGDTGNTGFLEVSGGSYGMIGARIKATWYYGADFIRGSAYIEGLYVEDSSEAVGVTRGLYVPATTANGGVAGLFRAEALRLHGHIAAHTVAVDLDNVFDFVSDANIQRWADATATNWTGYKLNNVNAPDIDGKISGNDASGGVTTLGISATGANSAHGIVTARFENLDIQFNLDANTSHWSIRSLATGATPDVYTLLGTHHSLTWLNSDGSVTYKSDQLSGPIMTGSYTPTLTNVANVASNANYPAQYSRVGNMVRVNGRLDIAATAGATMTQVGISLPVASALTAIEQCTGGGAGISTNAAVSITGDAANDRAQLNVIPAATPIQGYTYSFQYQVLP